MDRRKTLAAVGAISLTASAAVVALGSSIGLFGLADTSSNVGKLSPIDVTRSNTPPKTTVVNDLVPAPSGATPPATTTRTTAAGTHVEDHHHEHPAGAATTPTSTVAGDDHSGDRGTDDSANSAPGTGTGHDHDDD